MACWNEPHSCSTRVRRMSEKRTRRGRFNPRLRKSSTSSRRSMRVELGPAGVTSTWPASLMEKKSRPQPVTLYSSSESLTVQARSSVCNCSRYLVFNLRGALRATHDDSALAPPLKPPRSAGPTGGHLSSISGGALRAIHDDSALATALKSPRPKLAHCSARVTPEVQKKPELATVCQLGVDLLLEL